MIIDDIVDLSVNASVNSVNDSIPPTGLRLLKECRSEKALPLEVKATPTGLSMPPVRTGSMPDPSGCARKMCDARVTKGGLPGRS